MAKVEAKVDESNPPTIRTSVSVTSAGEVSEEQRLLPGEHEPRVRPKGPKFALTKAQKKDIQEAFQLFDAEGAGEMNSKDFKVAIRALGFEVDKEKLKELIAKVDTRGTGKLSYGDFLVLMTMQMGEKDSKEDIIKAFRLMDQDSKGKITLEDLQRVADELGEDLTEEELQEMIDVADKKGDGDVNEEDFIKLIRRANLN